MGKLFSCVGVEQISVFCLRTELMCNYWVIDIVGVNDLGFKEKWRYIKCKRTV